MSLLSSTFRSYEPDICLFKVTIDGKTRVGNNAINLLDNPERVNNSLKIQGVTGTIVSTKPGFRFETQISKVGCKAVRTYYNTPLGRQVFSLNCIQGLATPLTVLQK